MIGHISFTLGSITLMILGIIHLTGLDWGINVCALLLCSKSCSLPKGEIPEGPEHATNAYPEPSAYDDTLDKLFMVNNTVRWAQLNPLEQFFVHVLMMFSSGQRLIMRSINNQNQQDEVSTPNNNIYYHESTTRLPKGSNSYGNGGLILGNCPRMQANTKVTQFLRSFMDCAGNGESNEMKLDIINGKITNLYKLLCNENLLIKAYQNVRSNAGGMTPGADGLTLDGFNQEVIDNLIEDLKSEKFKFTSVKRVYIPKSNGKTRPLGIPSGRDKVVQEAMRILLEVIYEGKFSDLSHGFRPNRSCHTALKQISKWNGITWMIEGDIKGFFDNVNHTLLAGFLQKHIKDQRFIDLYWKLVRAGYIDDGVKYNTFNGVPQGGIVSPILSNIYLHEFDTYVQELIEEFSSKEKNISKVNPKIVNFSNKLSTLNDEYQSTKDINILKEIKELRAERNALPSRIRNESRIWYVRYADDWVIGLVGDKELAKKLKDLCKAYLKEKLELELSEEKTKITNVTINDVRFLGVDIRRNVSEESKIVYRTVKGRTIKSRISYSRLYFYVPVQTILDKLTIAGFIKTYTDDNGNTKLVPNAITKWIFLDHRSIILRYNAVIRGLINYYGFVDNLYSFHPIVNLFLHHSCAKTLARKFNLDNRAKAFKEFGRFLEAPGEGKLKAMGLYAPKHFKKNIKILQKHKTVKIDPFDVVNWNLRTQIGFFEPCWVCGMENDTEMHHVKHLRKAGVKPDGFTALMSTLNRKQIPVCKSCHNKIHQGAYNGMKLNELHIKKEK